MPAPSQLSIATSSVARLLKEEASYHKEFEQQQQRIKRLETTVSGENAEYQMRQERKVLEETQAVFPPLRQRITAAAAKLEQQLNHPPDDAGHQELAKGQEALRAAKELK